MYDIKDNGAALSCDSLLIFQIGGRQRMRTEGAEYSHICLAHAIYMHAARHASQMAVQEQKLFSL